MSMCVYVCLCVSMCVCVCLILGVVTAGTLSVTALIDLSCHAGDRRDSRQLSAGRDRPRPHRGDDDSWGSGHYSPSLVDPSYDAGNLYMSMCVYVCLCVSMCVFVCLILVVMTAGTVDTTIRHSSISLVMQVTDGTVDSPLCVVVYRHLSPLCVAMGRCHVMVSTLIMEMTSGIDGTLFRHAANTIPLMM